MNRQRLEYQFQQEHLEVLTRQIFRIAGDELALSPLLSF